MKDLIIKIKGDISGFKEAIGKVKAQANSLQGRLESIGGAMQKTGMAMTAIAGTAAAGLGFALKKFMDYESELANVRKTTGLTKEEMKKLDEGIRELAKDMPVAHTELAKIAAVAGQLGIQGTDNILKFTETVAKISAAFDMTAEESATAMAKLANIYNIPIMEIDRLASAINKLGNTTAASESEIIRALFQLGAAGKMLGLTGVQAAALTDTLIALGMAPERAATRLQSAFNMMGGNIGKLAEMIGMDVEELRKRFEEDFYGTLMFSLKKMQEIYTDNDKFLEQMNARLEKLAKGYQLPIDAVYDLYDAFLQMKEEGIAPDLIKKKFSEMSEEIGISKQMARKLASAFIDMSEESTGSLSLMTAMSEVFGKVGAKAMMALAGRADLVATNMRNATQAFEENTSLQEEYENKTDTLAAKLQKLLNNFVDIALAIGDELKPAIEELLPYIKEMIPDLKNLAITFVRELIPAMKPFIDLLIGMAKQFNELPEPVKQNIARFAALAVAISAVAGPILTVAGTLLPYLGVAITALTGPIGLVLAAIGLFAAAWIGNWFGIRDNTFAAIDAIKSGIEGAGKWVQDRINDIANFIASTLDLGRKAYEWGSNLLSSFIDGIKSQFRWLTDVVSSAADIVASYLGIHSDAKKGALSDLTKWGVNLAKTIAEGMYVGLPEIATASNTVAQTIKSTTIENTFHIQATIREEADIDRLVEAIDRRLARWA